MEAPTPNDLNQEISQTIQIEQDNTKYSLHLNSIGDIITFSLDYNSNIFTKKISLKEIKDKETTPIFFQYKTKDFMEFLKTLSELKKILLVEKDNIISLKFEVEIMFKKHEIEIELKSQDQNLELIKKELNELKLENKELKKRVENLEAEMKEIKEILNSRTNIIKKEVDNKSVIMKENEFELIHLAIKSRVNKKIKELKKLYQATVDGDGPINFHSRCDNIPNTIVLIKSAGNRRFGGFTSVKWNSSSGEYKDDPKAFLFSLDKQKIYTYKKNGKAIYTHKDYGPCFGGAFDIYIGGQCIQEKNLYTYETSKGCSYNYNGDRSALSLSGHEEIYAVELEVFQVIFE